MAVAVEVERRGYILANLPLPLEIQPKSSGSLKSRSSLSGDTLILGVDAGLSWLILYVN